VEGPNAGRHTVGLRCWRNGRAAISVGLVVTATVIAVTGISGCASGGSAKHSSSSQQGLPLNASTRFYKSGDKLSYPFPVVTGKFGDVPVLSRGIGALPSGQTAVELSAGNGPVVPTGSVPLIRYVRADWASGAIRHSSWTLGLTDEQPPADGTAISLDRFLVDKRVGSRIEALIPASDGRTVDVFVVDIQQASRPALTQTNSGTGNA
jgi:hypothetical protein